MGREVKVGRREAALVVAKRLPVTLPEIGGDLAYYWDSFEPAAMAEVYRAGMQAFAADVRRPAALRARAAQFTWERAAAAYLKLYRELLEA